MSTQDHPQRPISTAPSAKEPVQAAPPETDGVCAVTDTGAPGELLVFNEDEPDSEWISLDAPVSKLDELTWAMCPYCGFTSPRDQWNSTTWDCPECGESAAGGDR